MPKITIIKNVVLCSRIQGVLPQHRWLFTEGAAKIQQALNHFSESEKELSPTECQGNPWILNPYLRYSSLYPNRVTYLTAYTHDPSFPISLAVPFASIENHRLLRDLCHENDNLKPFEGKTILLCGDFR